MADLDTIIVGGGISGLTCAALLANSDRGDILLLESSDRPGGKMQTDHVDGYLCERGPTTLLDNVPETRSFIDLLGLTDQWIPASTINHNRFIWREGSRIQLPSPPRVAWKALTCPILSPAGKLRMALEPLTRRGHATGETLRSFATRRMGAEASRNLLEPFATGIHACDPAQLEVESAFPKLVRAERVYGNLFPGMFKQARELRGDEPRRKTTMRSFDDGLETLPRAIAERLGNALRLSHAVETIEPSGSGYTLRVRGPDGQTAFTAQRVVLALPHTAAARILRGMPAATALADELDAIGMAPVAIVHVGARAEDLRAPINGFGHLIVRGGAVRTLGSIYSSSIFPGRTPSDDTVLISNFTGGTLDPAAVELPDDELSGFVVDDLRTSLGLEGEPLFSHIIRWREAFPQYHVGHAARCKRIREHVRAMNGLHLAGNYLDGLSINDCIRSATELAQSLGAHPGA